MSRSDILEGDVDFIVPHLLVKVHEYRIYAAMTVMDHSASVQLQKYMRLRTLSYRFPIYTLAIYTEQKFSVTLRFRTLNWRTQHTLAILWSA